MAMAEGIACTMSPIAESLMKRTRSRLVGILLTQTLFDFFQHLFGPNRAHISVRLDHGFRLAPHVVFAGGHVAEKRNTLDAETRRDVRRAGIAADMQAAF